MTCTYLHSVYDCMYDHTIDTRCSGSGIMGILSAIVA